MNGVKVGDELRCLVDRPKCAEVWQGDIVRVTHVASNGDMRFEVVYKDKCIGGWYGNIKDGYWAPVIVDLENK